MDTIFTRFTHYTMNVPEELKSGDVWVTCDEYKVPLIAVPNGACFAAKSTDPDTWRSYETALTTWTENEHIAGIGRVIIETEAYAGLDIDDCIDDQGQLAGWAEKIIDRLDSYSEISPSLTGAKIWVKAPELTTSYKKPGLEIYCGRRYFTVTGLPVGEPRPIVGASDELAAIIEEEFPKVDRDRGEYNGPRRVHNLEDFLERAQIEILTIASDGAAERKYSILCPWVHEHSDGDVSGTYCGQYENGALFFHCWHSHCAHRRWREFKEHLSPMVYLGRPSRCNGKGGRLR